MPGGGASCKPASVVARNPYVLIDCLAIGERSPEGQASEVAKMCTAVNYEIVSGVRVRVGCTPAGPAMGAMDAKFGFRSLPYPAKPMTTLSRRGAGAVDRGGLENRCTLDTTDAYGVGDACLCGLPEVAKSEPAVGWTQR